MEQFDRVVNRYLSVLNNNEYVSAGLALFLVLYAGLAAPQLPESVARLFDNPFFKLLIFFLIAYSSKQNPTVAIIAAVGVMVSLMTLNRYKVNRGLVNIVQAEEAAMANANPNNVGAEAPLPEELVLMEGAGSKANVPSEVLSELDGCVRNANWRNSFYPQYVNMKPDAYMARYSGNAVSGFDSTANYAQAY